MQKQAGLSLSELLISLFLSTVIMTTLIQLYLGSKRQYIETEKILETSFDLQWVNDLLTDSIRRAGFTPCLGLDYLHVIDRRNHPKNSPALNIENQPQQFIQVSRMKENFSQLIKVESPTRLVVERSVEFNEKRPLIIADCEHAEIHEQFRTNQQLNETEITLSKPLMNTYGRSAYVGEFLEERWFIKKNAQRNNTLHYQLAQTEEVTALVHSLHTQQNKRYLEVSLGLKDEKNYKIKIAVRGS
jgi:hypothetical protein